MIPDLMGRCERLYSYRFKTSGHNRKLMIYFGRPSPDLIY